jgi:ornithine decarboxylase
VYDLGALHRCFAGWQRCLPGVRPHYAVKANPDPGLLSLLAALGAGFDCASRAEIAMIMGLGVHPDRIVYAHPCKPPGEVRFACARGVALTTFDAPGEVAKLAAWHPGARALLRIRVDDPTARFCLGSKYGCEVGDAPALLSYAKRAGVTVAGVAFHVGSGARDPAAFGRAVAAAADVFAVGRAAGHKTMTILDCGGGFAGGDPALPDAGLGEVAAALRAALATHFPPGCGVRVIAEPGRFFAEPVGTLAVAVNGVRTRTLAKGGPPGPPGPGPTPSRPPPPPPADAVDYWLSDGVYGCLNSIIYDDACLVFLPLRLQQAEDGDGFDGADAVMPPCTATLYGPTCDSADVVARGVALPRLAVGDFVLCPRASAYSIAGASNFNGFQAAKAGAVYVYSLSGKGEVGCAV